MERHQQPIDGPVTEHNHPNPETRNHTGLLTRFVPNNLKKTSFYHWLLRFIRLLQFLSSVISLGIFSSRLYRVYRLVNSIKSRRGVNTSMGAVEGILAAAVLYTFITTLLSCIKKSANPGSARIGWLWVVMDLLFVGAFIAVTLLTRPSGGLAGARHCYSPRRLAGGNSNDSTGENKAQDKSCNLPWGTFILAIISTLLHALTASFHEVKDYRRRNKLDHEEDFQQQQQHTANVTQDTGAART